jgi:hypothetical protein
VDPLLVPNAGRDLGLSRRPLRAATPLGSGVLRAAGDFAPASTRQALLNLGIDADAIEVTAMRPPLGEATPPPGAVYAVHFSH